MTIKRYLNNIYSITLDRNDLEIILKRSKQLNIKRIRLDIDNNTKTVYISDKNMMYTIKGF